MSAIKAKHHLEVDGQKVFIQQDFSSAVKEKRLSFNKSCEVLIKRGQIPRLCFASHMRDRNIHIIARKKPRRSWISLHGTELSFFLFLSCCRSFIPQEWPLLTVPLLTLNTDCEAMIVLFMHISVSINYYFYVLFPPCCLLWTILLLFLVCIFLLEVVDAGGGCFKMFNNFLLVKFWAVTPLRVIGSEIPGHFFGLFEGRLAACSFCFKFVFLSTLKYFFVRNPENFWFFLFISKVVKLYFVFSVSIMSVLKPNPRCLSSIHSYHFWEFRLWAILRLFH